MGVEVSHNDVVITEVKRKVKISYKIGGTTGYRLDVSIMNDDGQTADGVCNREVFI